MTDEYIPTDNWFGAQIATYIKHTTGEWPWGLTDEKVDELREIGKTVFKKRQGNYVWDGQGI